MATLAKAPACDEYEWVVHGLCVVAPHLEIASRDALAMNATTSILDYWSIFGGPGGMCVGIVDPKAVLIARSISSPRSLASLLSHPACVGKVRERPFAPF